MKRLRFSKLAALLPQPKPRKTKTSLRVTASRLVPTSFDEDEEPTTKLSTAFVVVLALHVVAVGGIYAFHSIKSHRREADGTALKATVSDKKDKAAASVAPRTDQTAKAPAVAPAAEKISSGPAAAPALGKAAAPASQNFAPTPAPVQAKAPAGVPAGGASEKNSGPSAVLPQARPQTPVAAAVSPPAKAALPPAAAADSEVERTYTVKRGDNPWSIAKAQGVSYDDLIKLNRLDNPKKLQLGQVLKLPPKKTGN